MGQFNYFNYNNKQPTYKNTHPQPHLMNIAFFTKLWPRHDHSGQLQKSISLIESLINLNHRLVVCSDDENSKAKEELTQYPLEFLDINSKKISNSLNGMSKLQFKPTMFIFDSFQSEEKYSAFLYNRWNKCARILAVDELKNLQKWRRSMYKIMPNMLIPPNTMMSPEKPEQVFTIEQQRSILRSDYILTSNEHNYQLINKHLLNNKQSKYISHINYGFPLQEYYGEIAQLMYRPFRNRQNFVFIGNFDKNSNQECLFQLINFVWPMIREKLQGCQLHIYGVHGESGISDKVIQKWGIMKTREELKKMGVQFRGVMKSTQQLSEYKALLYPCVYSTGGHLKVIQSWFMHLPVITTPIGAEGLFLQCYDPSFSATSYSSTGASFTAERVFTQQQKKNSSRLKNYYNNRILTKKEGFTFGGSYENFSYKDFAESAIRIHNDEQYWNKSLENAHKIIKKNQCDRHLEIIIKKALVNIEIATFEGRSRAGYEQEWKRYTKSAQFNKKIRTA